VKAAGEIANEQSRIVTTAQGASKAGSTTLMRGIARSTLLAVAWLAFMGSLGISHGIGQPLGRISIVAAPNGEVVLDGHGTGIFTPNDRLETSPGVHEVVVRDVRSGIASPPQRVEVRAGETTFVYARPLPATADPAACEGVDHAACFRAIERAMRAGDRVQARRLARRYVARYPEGAYLRLAKPIARLEVAGARSSVLRELGRSPLRVAMATLSMVGLLGLGVALLRRVRRERDAPVHGP
jgi:hypothetical protein